MKVSAIPDAYLQSCPLTLPYANSKIHHPKSYEGSTSLGVPIYIKSSNISGLNIKIYFKSKYATNKTYRKQILPSQFVVLPNNILKTHSFSHYKVLEIQKKSVRKSSRAGVRTCTLGWCCQYIPRHPPPLIPPCP